MNGALWPAFAIAAIVSLVVDRFAAPRGPVRRAPAALAVHLAAVICVAFVVLLITQRPVFSAFVAVLLVALVVLVSNAKYDSLRESFVFTDLSLFSQLFSHPRLYLPFLSVGKALAICAGVLVVVIGYFLEPSMVPAPAFAVLLVLGTVSVLYGLSKRLSLTLDPAEDVRRHGFFAVFVAYLLNGLRPATFTAFEHTVAASPFVSGKPTQQPDVIVIQSESFFDARRISAAVDPATFEFFDIARNESVCHGLLSVPAWGANTMRTEFSFLTGLTSQKLGYARFYPYLFVRRACASLAAWFKRGSYETVAIHPYYADFFGRQRALPLMGFNKFLDIEHFAGALRAGPYISDAAIVDAIIDQLDVRTDRPRFLFVMTMENHGPLHLETVEPGEAAQYHGLGEDPAWRDLTAYLRHVSNADAMIGRLLEYLRARHRDTVLCFYGDHVPALSHIYERLGEAPSLSDYFIWRNFGDRSATRQDLPVEQLGTALIRSLEGVQSPDSSVGGAKRPEYI